MRDLHGWTYLPTRHHRKVSVAVASYNNPDGLATLIASFRAQTHPNWELVVVHDGPGPESRRLVDVVDDPRIVFYEAEHRGSWGHPHREAALRRCTGDILGLTNEDNYYVPVYLEAMVNALETKNVDLVYCNTIHSHHLWAPMDVALQKGRIDLGSWLANRSAVADVPFRDFSFAGDWTFLSDVLAKCKTGTTKIDHYLFVHN